MHEGCPPFNQAVHAKPAIIALEDESGQNEPMRNWRERISVNPPVCHGRACVRGIRVLVSVKVDNEEAYHVKPRHRGAERLAASRD